MSPTEAPEAEQALAPGASPHSVFERPGQHGTIRGTKTNNNSSPRLEQLTGQQKVAVVLAQLGTESSASILRSLSDEEAVVFTTEIANLPPLDRDVVEAVVREFVDRVNASRAVGQGGLDRARSILSATLGAQRAEEVLSQIHGKVAVGPLAFLSQADPNHVVPFLIDEHPQTIAVILAHLPAGDAAALMDALPSDFRAEVVQRIATMDRVAPDAISQAASLLAGKLRGLISTGMSVPGGIPSLVEILNRTDGSTEKQVLADLEERDRELAEAVRARMFTFEDVLALDDRTLQIVLRSVSVNDLALAIKGSGDDGEVMDKLRRNLSDRAAAELDEEMEVMGAVRISMVDAAQANIVRIVRDLEAEGTVVLARASDEML
ncbi:MAG TPA: flagellar motor switch protein FliG [Acidimicrobiales bacterium]|nr:flagellar motor switch protein FliG [Acidimicrobiales bacterium]